MKLVLGRPLSRPTRPSADCLEPGLREFYSSYKLSPEILKSFDDTNDSWIIGEFLMHQRLNPLIKKHFGHRHNQRDRDGPSRPPFIERLLLTAN